MKNRIKGLLWGQAIGDALGLATEFMTKEEVAYFYPDGIKDYQDIISDSHRCRWKKGAWTDDTDQMLCVLDSLIENKSVNLNDIASKFVNWKKNNGMGIGRQTYNILSISDYTDNPHKVSEIVWEMSRKMSAPNGGIMRTAIVGCWNYSNWKQIQLNTENICKLTHFDPRCVGSCTIITFIIHKLLQEAHFSKDDLLDIANQYDPQISNYIDLSYQPDVDLLQLDEKGKAGYTLKTMAAALWAYNNTHNYKNGLSAIITQGGDADTNGAVTGALLGCKYGYQDIPNHLKNNLIGKEVLEEKANQLIRATC